MLRGLGYLFCLLAIVVVGFDVVRLISTGEYKAATLGATWYSIHSGSLAMLQPGIERHVSPWLWSAVFQPVLTAPLWLVLAILGAAFFGVALLRRR